MICTYRVLDAFYTQLYLSVFFFAFQCKIAYQYGNNWNHRRNELTNRRPSNISIVTITLIQIIISCKSVCFCYSCLCPSTFAVAVCLLRLWSVFCLFSSAKCWICMRWHANSTESVYQEENAICSLLTHSFCRHWDAPCSRQAS